MSDELAVAGSQTPGTASDQARKPGIERQNPVDFAAVVFGREIESLRRVADGLDREYESRKLMKFKDRLAYLAIRERLACKIVDFTEKLCGLRTTNPTTEFAGSESSGSLSWDPDADQPAKFPQAQ